MKSRARLLVFCSLALVQLALQFAVLYVWLQMVDQDEMHYDAAKDFYWSHYLAMVTFPGSLVFATLPEPRSQLVGWMSLTAVFVLNSVLWSGVVCAVFWLSMRLFRSRPPQVGQPHAPANTHESSSLSPVPSENGSEGQQDSGVVGRDAV